MAPIVFDAQLITYYITCRIIITSSPIVKTLGLETRLDALSVLVNGIPVSVSNDIIPYSDIQGLYESETTTDILTTTYIIIIAAVAIVVIVGILALSTRKRKA